MEEMMNKLTRTSLVVLITLMVLLAVVVPVQAKKPPNFFVHYIVGPVDYDHLYAAGIYDVMTFPDYSGDGTAILHWVANNGAKPGTMILEDGYGALMTIRFLISWKDASGGCTVGHFDIQASLSDGLYDMTGTGIMTMCVIEVDGDDYFEGDLEGWVKESNPNWP
jgi:hypothetical protein